MKINSIYHELIKNLIPKYCITFFRSLGCILCRQGCPIVEQASQGNLISGKDGRVHQKCPGYGSPKSPR